MSPAEHAWVRRCAIRLAGLCLWGRLPWDRLHPLVRAVWSEFQE